MTYSNHDARETHGFLWRHAVAPSPVERRTAVLVSKTLQNMANQLRFRGLEAYLSPLNTFIEANEPALQSFFASIVVREPPHANAGASVHRPSIEPARPQHCCLFAASRRHRRRRFRGPC